MKTLLEQEGLLSLWKGIKPAYFREATCTSIKLGGYGPLKKALGSDGPQAPFLPKFAAGSLSGALGTLVGNPFDVLKTKGMTDTQTAVPMFLIIRKQIQ